MLEVFRSTAAVIGCYGEAAALDGIEAPSGAMACRIAPDELALVGPPSQAGELDAYARAALPDALGMVVDQTDAWTLFGLSGERAREAFQRLCAIPPPASVPTFIQCTIAHVPGKVIALDGTVYLLVPAPVAHHVRERLLEGCKDIGVYELAPADFAHEAEARG